MEIQSTSSAWKLMTEGSHVYATDRATRSWDREPTRRQLALAHGHRWLAMLESGVEKSLRARASREGADPDRLGLCVRYKSLRSRLRCTSHRAATSMIASEPP